MKQLNSQIFHKQHKTDYQEPKTFKLPRKVDRGILNIAIALIVVGLVTVVSSSYTATKVYALSNFYFAIKHLIFCLMAIFFIRLFLTKLDWLDKFGTILWFVCIFALLILPFFSSAVKGANRWINVFGFSFQPSEFVKIAVILEGAKYLEKDLKRFAIVYLVPMALILMQPDLGSTFLIASLGIAQIITKHFNIKYIAIAFVAMCLLVLGAYFSFDHVHMRIDTFLNPDKDLFGAGYQRYKSFLAMKNGGFFGRGFGKGFIKDVLPDAHTDFVFSVIVEEFGVFGGLFVMFLYIALGYRVLKVLAANRYIQLVQYGFTISILSQAWLNIASTLSLIPTKGLTLPLISYGGSGMLMHGISFGILLATSKVSSAYSKKIKS